MRYIALLRGINVSGQKIIKMAELREFLTDSGFKNVSTYIQSGNIIFESDKANISILEDTVKETIERHYGFIVPTIVLTLPSVKNAIEKQSFNNIDDKKLYLTFLSHKPINDGIEELKKYQTNGEELKLIGSVLYIYSPNGVGKSKLTLKVIEKKLAVSATSRNWRTCGKLLALFIY
tara:strand:+ start:79 stop:609 length:531 start_codon:yes stop_codon:yes gene_type:complete